MRAFSIALGCLALAAVALACVSFRQPAVGAAASTLRVSRQLNTLKRGGAMKLVPRKTFQATRRPVGVQGMHEVQEAARVVAESKDAIHAAAQAGHNALAELHTLPPHMITALADAADAAAQQGNGPFGKFVNLIAGTIIFLSNNLQRAGISQSVGLSIVLFTALIKALTYPLNKQQIKSSETMAVIQPKIKEIQEKYKDDPNTSAQKLQEVYAENKVNPLAGLLPAFAQIPIFIALYRALQQLATNDMMNQPFLWLPNLEGPTYGVIGGNWLFQNWQNGVPQFGWHDTLAYVSLPVILIASQIVSQRLLVSKEQYEAQPAWTKYLPIIFGYFSLNVPSGLAVYWTTNNIITTATNMALKSGFKNDPEFVSLKAKVAKIDAPVEKQMPIVKKKVKVDDDDDDGPQESSRGKASPPKKKSKKDKKKAKKNKGKKNAARSAEMMK
uniref:Membrane insertase YidC/Oxa/ALB C-terminal domain-containing protein n=1 Tax=Lotharella globosa TaxID=91324 RepID=A0A7S4DV94_9EUKA